MSDPVSSGLAVVAAGVALTAGWMQWPRPPSLDGERWFKMTLATLLIGRAEAADEDGDAWEEALRRWVPYHPAGRLPERKVIQPLADPPGKRLEGELVLQEALAAIPSVEARWARMYDTDPVALDALLADPFDLGPSYDPVTRLGPAHSWEQIAGWGADETAFRDALLNRLALGWVLVEGRGDRLAGPTVLDALAEEVAGAERRPWAEGTVEEQVADLIAQLEPHVQTRRGLVLVGEEAGVALILRAMQASAGLRDVVHAVVSIGGVIGGRPGESGPLGERDARDWLDAWFTLEKLDSELVHLTPWLAVQWLDRTAATPGARGLPLAAQRFPEPRDDGVIATLESVDLGPLPSNRDIPVHLVARALITTAGLWVLTRR